MKHFIELGWCYTRDRFFGADHLLFIHFHGHAHRGGTVALAVARLKHPYTAVLNGKFQILHILEVSFQLIADTLDLSVGFRHGRLQTGMSFGICLLYTSDAADEEDSVDLGGR